MTSSSPSPKPSWVSWERESFSFHLLILIVFMGCSGFLWGFASSKVSESCLKPVAVAPEAAEVPQEKPTAPASCPPPQATAQAVVVAPPSSLEPIDPIIINFNWHQLEGRRPASAGSVSAPSEEPFRSALSNLKFRHLTSASIKTLGDHLAIELDTQGLFLPGQSEFAPGREADIDVLAQALKPLSGDYEYEFAGYTDSEPVNKSKWRNPTNWELSANRAGRVLRQFESVGFDSRTLNVVGYGSARPRVSDRTPAGALIPDLAEKNRRVEIRVRHK